MRIIKAKNYDELSKIGANIIASQVTLVPDSVLGLATGSSVRKLYDELVLKYEGGELDFSQIMSINLDEYVGLDGTHSQSYRYYMNEALFDRVNIDKENTHLPDGKAKDVEVECENYESIIDFVDSIDLQLLGLGGNGHIGFNEPADSFPMATHSVDLTEETIEANSRFFDNIDDVPKKAITMGIKGIMQAKTVLLCVSGSHKAEALKKVLTGPVTPEVPGSILQLHKNLIVVADEEALSQL